MPLRDTSAIVVIAVVVIAFGKMSALIEVNIHAVVPMIKAVGPTDNPIEVNVNVAIEVDAATPVGVVPIVVDVEIVIAVTEDAPGYCIVDGIGAERAAQFVG